MIVATVARGGVPEAQMADRQARKFEVEPVGGTMTMARNQVSSQSMA